MGAPDTRHRPLVSGIRIRAVAISSQGERTNLEGGTLTGLATRNSDDEKMLVTNLHVISGTFHHDPEPETASYQLFQEDYPVLDTLQGEDDPTGVNFVDAAEFEIAEDVAAAHIPCKPASLATQPNSSPSPDSPTPYTPCSSPRRTPGPLYRPLPSPTHPLSQDARTPSATPRR